MGHVKGKILQLTTQDEFLEPLSSTERQHLDTNSC